MRDFSSQTDPPPSYHERLQALRLYRFCRLNMKLYIEVNKVTNSPDDCTIVNCSVTSAVALYVVQYCQLSECNIVLVLQHESDSIVAVTLPSQLTYIVEQSCKLSADIQRCRLPVVQTSSCMYKAGLCAVLRSVVKQASTTCKDLHALLGFRGCCLKACSEVSAWTKFCEVDVIASTTNFINNSDSSLSDFVRFNNHLSQPPRLANRRKHQRKRKQDGMTDGAITSHTYAEGEDMTLTDLILYHCIFLTINHSSSFITTLSQQFSHIYAWYHRIAAIPDIQRVSEQFFRVDKEMISTGHIECARNLTLDCTDQHQASQFHIRDTEKTKTKKKITRLPEILNKLKSCDINCDVSLHPKSNDIKLKWEDFPEEIHPSCGDLPEKRKLKKYEQLENLATTVRMLAWPGCTIVDFCSGGGHLGILLAYLLPQCQVILVENKEESLVKAEARILSHGLTNICCYQCNMNYFTDTFDIGTALHACGVATDLLLQQCINVNAAFVVCPCCYGYIQDTHTVTYPRSETFKLANITMQDSIMIGHAADMTELGIELADKGKYCMQVIDTDRKLQALEHEYNVMFCSLQPLTCSPKNNLLFGYHKNNYKIEYSW